MKFSIAAILALAWLILPAMDSAGAKVPPALHVQGNKLVDANGKVVRLLGVDFDGTEYACVGGGGGNGNGYGVFDWPNQADPPNITSFIAAMKRWYINAVRLPLNETCWQGINNAVNSLYAGVNYQNAIAGFVQALNNAGIYVILDLHWAEPGTLVANGQWAMPNNDHSKDFWFSVATYFKNYPGVIFDLFNEPGVRLGGEVFSGDLYLATAADWNCWLNGCTIPGGTPLASQTYQAAGMQQLLNLVRAAGATQPVMVGGNFYAQDMTQWLTYLPTDPTPAGWPAGPAWTPQIIASYHRYGCAPDCQAQLALDQTYQWPALQIIAKSHPVVAGEFGEYDCGTGYSYGFMDFFEAKGFSYLGWSWNNSDCANPSLLARTTGTNQDYYAADPSPEGQALLYRLAALAAAPATVLESATNPSRFGQSVTFTATVTSPAAATPTGKVTFKQGTTTLGTGTLSGGTATFATAALSVGKHNIKAVYRGNAIFHGSTSIAVSQAVIKGASTTSLGAAPNPSVFGHSVTLTATVAAISPAAGTPTGTVKFSVKGGSVLGIGSLSGGTAMFATSALSAGKHSIRASYSGDASFAASASPFVTQTVK